MPNLHDIVKSEKPYTLPIRVRILDKGEGHNENNIAVGDDSAVIECIIYDKDKLKALKLDDSVMIINGVIKKKPRTLLEIGSHTRIIKTGTVNTTDANRQEAINIVHPPAANFLDVASVESSPLKKLISLRGQVVGVSIKQ